MPDNQAVRDVRAEEAEQDSDQAVAPSSNELTDADRAKIAELSEAIEKFTAQKRWSDVIKATLHKAELVPDPSEKLALFADAGRMYLERSSNQAEAIKCFQRVLDLDRTNVEAITHLKEMYEKRRDWERLVDVMRIEAELLEPSDRAMRRIEIAQMATEKLRKPQVCIDLWQDVLQVDAANVQALTALSGLYERSREWAPLADVLEKQSEFAHDQTELIALLQKLGNVYSEKLQNDNGALSAYRRLLDLDPNDRRAQEQLKKRLVAASAWDELEQFYSAPDKVDELIRTLERAADNTAAEASERIALQFRVARLWQEKKAAPDRAARAYEKALVLDPENFEAAEALSPIYAQAGDPKKLAQVYEVRLKHTQDPEQRTVLLREMGLLYEEKLRNSALAFERFVEGFLLAPQTEVLREDIERLAEKTKDWQRAFAAYAQAIEQASHPDDAIALRLQYGKLLQAAGQTQQAIDQYRAVYDEQLEHPEAIAALEQLYRSAGQFQALLEILEQRGQLESDPEVRKQLAYDIAGLWRDNLNDPGRAIEAYRNIPAEFGEQESEAYRALDQLYESQERWEDLARTLDHRIDMGPESNEELAALKFRLAGVLHAHQGDSSRAVSLYREVLTLLPEHEGAMAALAQLMADETLGGEAASILIDVYESQGAYAQLAAALDVSVRFTSDPVERVALLTRAAEVRRSRLGDAAGAFAAYARAFEATPETPEILEQLEHLAREQGRVAELCTLIEQRARTLDDQELQRQLVMKVAALHENELNDVDAAVRAYNIVLEQDDSDEIVLAALEALYRRAERWPALLEVLRRRATMSSDPEFQENQLAQIAFVHDEMLSEPEAAIRVYCEILELNPQSSVSLQALDSLYERQQMWSDLADNVQRQLSLAEDDAAQVALLMKLGLLREQRMNAPEAAIEIYREVLERDPANVAAVEALERLLVHPKYQTQIAEILEPLYRERTEYAKLVRIHDIQVQNSNSIDQRVELLHRMAELYEIALEDLESAFRTFARALREDPSSTSTREELDRIAASAGAWQPLVDVYEELTKSNEDPTILALLHTRAAQIREEHLNDTPAAIVHHERVLEVDPSNVDAASALERLYQAAERYPDLARTYLAKAQLLPDPEGQREYLFRAGGLYEDVLEQPEAAVDVYERVLRLDAEDLPALDKLIQLHLRLQRWQPLLDAYGRKADVVADPDEKKRLYLEVGRVYEQQLNQLEKAIEVYQRVLDLDPDDLDALSRLDALYQTTGRSEELLSVLEREAELTPDPEHALDVRYRIGELHEQKLGDAFRAVEVYRDILEVNPEHAAALAALERMIEAKSEPVFAATTLEPVYRSAGDSPRLARVLEVLISHEEDPVRSVELYHQVAELYEVHLDDATRAFDAYSRALPVDPQNQSTMAALDRLAEKLGSFQALAELYDRVAGKLNDSARETKIDLCLRAAQLFEQRLSDVHAAIARYRMVADLEPDHLQALEALERLYEGTENWTGLAQVLERKVSVASSPDEILDIQFKLGQFQQYRLNDVSKAVGHYRDILAAAPEHAGALQALEGLFDQDIEVAAISEILEPLYRMQESWDRLIGVQVASLRVQRGTEERVEIMRRIAEIAEDRAQDPASAFLWTQRALLEAPDNDSCVTESERLAESTSGFAQLANTYATIAAESHWSVEQRVATGKRLSRVYFEELKDVARAEESYRFVLGLAPRDEDALAALDQIYTDHGASEPLVEVLRRRVAVTSDTLDKVELSHRLGQVLWNDCRRPDDAIAVYRGLLDDLDPQHEDTLHELQNIYTLTQNWPALFEAYERELGIVMSDSAQAETLGRMAMLAATKLDNLPRAVELLRKVLDLLGEDPEALNALGNIYSQQENWPDLVDVLEREVAVSDDETMRIRIYADLGRIWYEKLRRDRNALESWERVLDIEPANTDALFAMANIHRAAHSYEDLASSLHRMVEAGATALDDAAIEAAYMELGAIYNTQLQQPSDAVAAYNKALEVNPANFAALDALEQIHGSQEQWEDAIEVKQRRVKALEDSREKIAVLLDIARMCNDNLQEADRATGPLNQVLEIDPLHHYAFERLEELHRQAGRFDELVSLFLTRVEAAPDEAQRVVLLRNVAKIYERDLDDRAQAFDALLIAWTQDFTDEESAREVERMAGLTQRWNELLTTANQSLSELDPNDNKTRNAICVKCARWYGREGHPEYAIPYLQQVLTNDPVNRPAMRQLAELYKQTQQWQYYAQVLGKLVEMTEDARERADAYAGLGELHEEQFKQPDHAIKHYREALEAVPTHLRAIRALERMYRSREQWQELVEVLRRKVSAVEEPEEVLLAKLELAEAYEERVADKSKAIEQYKRVLEVDAENLQALKGLERLYLGQQLFQDLLDVLERQLEVVQNERDQVVLLVRIAGMWEQEFLKPEKAAERLERVVELDPLHTGALTSLARIYRVQRRWPELVRAYERHIDATHDRAEKVELYRKIGEIYRDELKEQERAIDSFLNATSLEPDNADALRALSALYEAANDHASALDAFERLARATSDRTEQVSIHHRMGKLLAGELGDRVAALGAFQKAIELDPNHVPSYEEMRSIHLDAAEYVSAARALARMAEIESNPKRSAQYRVELGNLYEEKLEEHGQAIQCFESAVHLDPDNVDAALPLVREYARAGRWKEAEPLLQLLVRASVTRDPGEQQSLWLLYGQCAEELGDNDVAARAFGKAFDLDAQDLSALRGLAAAHYRNKSWDNAFKYFQMVLVHHRDALSSAETVEVCYRLGVIKREQGERKKALNLFEKALEEDGYHRPTLDALIALHEADKDYEQVIHYKKRALETVDAPNERFALLDEIGDYWNDKLKNAVKAIEAYVDASEIQPKNHKLLHKLLSLYQATSQWEPMIEIIDRIAELEPRNEAKAKYAYTIGVITRDELKDAPQALERFNRALDLDPIGMLKAFEAINKLLTQQKDWRELERAFRKMLHRVTGKGDATLEFNLWHNLGVIYRDRQQNHEAAAESFAMASRLQPDNMLEHQILAEIYGMVPSRVADAVAQHQILLKNDATRRDSYRALYKLFMESKQYDKAWCVAATMTYLRKADDEHRQFYEQYKPDGPIRPRNRLTNERWVKDLLHPDEDFLAGKVFEAVTPAVLRLRAQPDKRWSLSKKDLIPDVMNTTVSFARTFGFVTQVLSLPFVPRLFVCPDRQGGLAFATTQPPATVCGAALLSGQNPLDVVFIVAKHLAYYRGEHYIRTIFQTKDELKLVLAAAMNIAGVEINDPNVVEWAKQIRAQMQPADLELLKSITKRFVDAGARTDIKRWMQSVELSACRAGFMLCNDLEIAARMLQAEPPMGAVDLTPKEKIQELILFSVSESYFRLREALGIQIQVRD
ncbi:MAG TPA: tetratricopeptide repeat protein [Polyangiales bacterium]|nr:tetratricopeptide repeat protein [Polyangiales bacterium]